VSAAAFTAPPWNASLTSAPVTDHTIWSPTIRTAPSGVSPVTTAAGCAASGAVKSPTADHGPHVGTDSVFRGHSPPTGAVTTPVTPSRSAGSGTHTAGGSWIRPSGVSVHPSGSFASSAT
jgi:hypothetical protein